MNDRLTGRPPGPRQSVAPGAARPDAPHSAPAQRPARAPARVAIPQHLDAEEIRKRVGRHTPASTPAERAARGLELDAATRIARTSLDIGELLGQVSYSDIKVTLVPRPGVELAAGFTAEPGTKLELHVVFRDGALSPPETKLVVLDRDGKPARLDGPLFFDLAGVRVDQHGRLQAQIRMLPEVDVTDRVLPGASGLPKDPRALAALAQRHASIPMQIDLAGGNNDVRGPSTPSRFAELFDSAQTQIRAAGELAPSARGAPVSVGNNSRIAFAPGTKFELSGYPDDLLLTTSAAITRAEFGSARGVALSVGGPGASAKEPAGRMDLTVRSIRDASGETRQLASVSQFELRDVRLTSPSADGGESVLELGSMSVQAVPGRPAMEVDGEHLKIDVDAIFGEVSGQIRVRDAEGNPGVAYLGPKAAAATGPMSLAGRLRVDTRRDELEFSSAVVGLHASAEAGPKGILLADRPDLRLAVSSLAVEGNGHLSISQRGDDVRMVLFADDAITADVELKTLHVERTVLGAALEATLQPMTRGRVEMRTISFPPENLDLGLTLDVNVAGMSLALPGGEVVRLGAGSTGKLKVETMRQRPGDAYPEIKGELDLQLGAEARLLPTTVRGFTQGKGLVTAATLEGGSTRLRLPFEMRADGTVSSRDGQITLRGLRLKSAVEKGDTSNKVLPEVALLHARAQREAALIRAIDAELASALPAPPRPPPPVRALTAPKPADDAIDVVTKMVETAKLTLDARLPAGATATVRKYGYTLPVTLETASTARVVIDGSSGKISPENTRITFDPPLRLSAMLHKGFVTNHLPDALRRNSVEKVHGLVVERAVDGTLRFKPVFENERGVVFWSVARIADLGALLAKELLGTEEVPTDAPQFFERLVRTTRGAASSDVGSNTELARELRAVTGSLTNATFKRGVVDLGDGQSLEIKSGRDLTVRKDRDAVHVTGLVELGPANLGVGPHAVKLASGKARIEMTATIDPAGGPPRLRVKLTDLEAEGLSVDVRTADNAASLRGGRVRGASLELGTDERGVTQVRATIPKPEVAELSWTSADGTRVHMKNARASTVQITPGAGDTNVTLEGVFGQLDADIQKGAGPRLIIPRVEVAGGTLRITSNGEIETDSRGLAIRDGQATVVGLGHAPPTAKSAADGAVLLKIDRGSVAVERGVLHVSKARGIELAVPDDARPMSLRGRGDLSFYTPSPYFEARSKNVVFDAKARRIAAGGEQGYAMHLEDTYATGTASGTLYVGPEGDQLERLSLEDGSAVRIALKRVVASSGAAAATIEGVLSARGTFSLPEDRRNTRRGGVDVHAEARLQGEILVQISSDSRGLLSAAQANIDSGTSTLNIEIQPAEVAAARERVLETVQPAARELPEWLRRAIPPPANPWRGR